MKKTPLFSFHQENSAKIIDFHGWALPLYYSGANNEHLAVRNNVGLFDVSHMGEIRVKGANALTFLNTLLTCNLDKVKNFQAVYCMMLNDLGGIIDDVICYRISSQEAFLCINAVNISKKFSWILKQQKKYNFELLDISNESDDWAQVAIQGPFAQKFMSGIYNDNGFKIKKFYFANKVLPNSTCQSIVARTGYTGENGFEIFINKKNIQILLNRIEEIKKQIPLTLCGLSARDSLRVEAGYCLHGQDIHEDVNPIEANLEWTLKFNKKESFVGKDKLLFYKNNKMVTKKFVGLKINGRRIARTNDIIYMNDKKIGSISSGVFSPYLKHPIALGYLDGIDPNGVDKVNVKIRGLLCEAQIQTPPFFSK